MTLTQYLDLHPKKHLIFDLDETLALLHMNWSTITQGIFDLVASIDKPLTLQAPQARFAAIYLSNAAIKKHGKSMQDRINEYVVNYERDNYSGYTPNVELIKFLKSDTSRGYRCSIWTTNTTDIVNDFISKEGLVDRFSVIVTHNDVLQLKPENSGFAKIYIPHTPLTDYLLVGDSVNDEGAAKNAGIDFFKIEYFSRQ